MPVQIWTQHLPSTKAKRTASGAGVHHNFIHDVHAYPVVVGDKAELPMLIEANLIHYAWHAIAGSGDPGTGYEARYNRIAARTPPAGWKMPAPGHAFDMHAYRPLEKDRKGRVAGDRISIRHNTAELLGAGGSITATPTVRRFRSAPVA